MTDEKKKISIDFKQENYEVLRKLAKDLDTPMGRLINDLISSFLDVDDSTKEEFSLRLTHIIIRNNDIYSEQPESVRKAITLENQKIEGLLKILNPKGIFDEISFGQDKKKIRIKDGYAFVPKDWKVLKNKNPEECTHVGVIRIRNSKKYNFPCYLFFSESQINLLNVEEMNEIYALIQDANPSFQKIQAMQICPCYDSQTGEFLNKELWEMSPDIMVYELMVYGEDTSYPLDAMICREKI